MQHLRNQMAENIKIQNFQLLIYLYSSHSDTIRAWSQCQVQGYIQEIFLKGCVSILGCSGDLPTSRLLFRKACEQETVSPTGLVLWSGEDPPSNDPSHQLSIPCHGWPRNTFLSISIYLCRLRKMTYSGFELDVVTTVLILTAKFQNTDCKWL